MGGMSMDIKEKYVAHAFFVGGELVFEYDKGQGYIVTERKLHTVTDLKMNDDDHILVGGYTYEDGNLNDYQYKQFFLDKMRNVRVYKRIDPAELDS